MDRSVHQEPSPTEHGGPAQVKAQLLVRRGVLGHRGFGQHVDRGHDVPVGELLEDSDRAPGHDPPAWPVPIAACARRRCVRALRGQRLERVAQRASRRRGRPLGVVAVAGLRDEAGDPQRLADLGEMDRAGRRLPLLAAQDPIVSRASG